MTDTKSRPIFATSEIAQWPEAMKAYFAQEFVNPRTKRLRNLDDTLIEMSGTFLIAFKEVWQEEGMDYATLGDFLRLMSNNVETLAWDWAQMTDEGADI